jgi:hypothetical protein
MSSNPDEMRKLNERTRSGDASASEELFNLMGPFK